ncbi:hypothetical protein DPMN_098934 [Dreissena polymorpha]|uniref:Uncharacterized protein n=1 Tax=Dreissena polymorpha TaxID=45954 RepID=A0A9D4R6T7_DREPO|nr:hypothetical protein DPMN_098934 [Dreissena polymorpha]
MVLINTSNNSSNVCTKTASADSCQLNVSNSFRCISVLASGSASTRSVVSNANLQTIGKWSEMSKLSTLKSIIRSKSADDAMK